MQTEGFGRAEDLGNEDKLGELILYVSERCSTHRLFGATKLNKIMFLADSYSFLERGKPITGVPYRKLDAGPVPRRLVQVRKKLQDAGDLAIKEHQMFSLSQERTIALRNANLSEFTPDEIALVDTVIEELKDKNARECSLITHRMAGWKVAMFGEDIPYSMIFIDDDPAIGEVQIEQAKRVQETFGDNL